MSSYRVYLGTTLASVTAANPASPEYRGEVNGPSFALSNTLAPGVTYLWRVDAISPLGATPGNVYSFTVSTISASSASVNVATVRGHADFKTTIALDAATAGTAWQASANQPWVTFTQSAGVTPATLEVHLNASALPLGNNTAAITLSNTSGALFTLPVKLKVEPLVLTVIKSDPLSKYAYAISEDATAASPNAYLLEIDTQTEGITRVVPVGNSGTDLAIHNPDNRIYVPNWLPGSVRAIDKTSFAQVRTYAFNPYPTSTYSGYAFRVTRAAATVPLNIIGQSYLEFAFRAGNQAVDEIAYWNNSEAGEGVVVEFSLDGVTWQTLQTLDTVYPSYAAWTNFVIALPAATQSSATRFRWRQLAHSGGTNDTWALEDVCLWAPVPPAPSAPPFIITAVNSSSSIAIWWVGSTGASSYQVERTGNGSAWNPVATTSVTQTYFTDTGLRAGTWYQYRVKAINLGGISPASSVSIASTLRQIDEWRLAHFGTTDSTGAAASMAAGPDGITNLARFAFNMSNTAGVAGVIPGSGQAGMPSIRLDPLTHRLRVEFIRRKWAANPGDSYEVQFCSDLSCFVPGGAPVQVTSINGIFERVVWEDAVSINESAVRFARVKLTETP